MLINLSALNMVVFDSHVNDVLSLNLGYPHTTTTFLNFPNKIKALYSASEALSLNTPGTRGGPGGRDRTVAVKNRKNAQKSVFFVNK